MMWQWLGFVVWGLVFFPVRRECNQFAQDHTALEVNQDLRSWCYCLLSSKAHCPFLLPFLSITCTCSPMCAHHLSHPPVHEQTWAKADVYPACVKTTFLLLDSPKGAWSSFFFFFPPLPVTLSGFFVCVFVLRQSRVTQVGYTVGTSLELVLPPAPEFQDDNGTPLCHLAFPLLFFLFALLLFFPSHLPPSPRKQDLFAASKVIAEERKERRNVGVYVGPTHFHGRLLLWGFSRYVLTNTVELYARTRKTMKTHQTGAERSSACLQSQHLRG